MKEDSCQYTKYEKLYEHYIHLHVCLYTFALHMCNVTLSLIYIIRHFKPLMDTHSLTMLRLLEPVSFFLINKVSLN